jgi:hypothetical protein
VTATFPHTTRVYVWVPDTAGGDDAAGLTTLPVEMAFMGSRETEPADADWHDAEWADTPRPTARCLLGDGAGGVDLARGDWWAWVRVTGAVERPARLAGRIKIT